MRLWCNSKVLRSMSPLGERQSFDLGRKVVLLTRSKLIKPSFRSSKKEMEKMGCLNLHKSNPGMKFSCSKINYDVIFLSHKLCELSFIAVAVHEVNHVVDNMFRSSHMKVIDTELRSYMIQYYLEEILIRMSRIGDNKALENCDKKRD